ncbi:DUF420 domain-containing protein [Engelhardtia mirabilis]|uniref:DUF420 domain-containing protein n=1 Tax=Engelhardtia mirabilis TaxID=2528011 RepID=A0A518BIZ0_9BACT|nr:hypothetical protein Pla133_20120 [Planctomycetes bacterium Pla133]QDV01263.1 hypothetical protein Pla86_20120 [Planctomycetes bacterium Pla86]
MSVGAIASLVAMQGDGGAGTPLHPLVNAFMNGTATVLLLAGLAAIKADRRELHARLMTGAFVASSIFLVSYLAYHFGPQKELGPTAFNGPGPWKVAYLVLLITHLIGAVVNLPMVLRTFWLAHRERWEDHKRWARWTFPIWLYVSVTGVVIYLVLYPFNPPPA